MSPRPKGRSSGSRRSRRTTRGGGAWLFERIARGLFTAVLLLIVALFVCSVLGFFDWRDLRPGRNAQIAPVGTWEVLASELNANRADNPGTVRVRPGVARQLNEDQGDGLLEDPPNSRGPENVHLPAVEPEKPVRVCITNGCGANLLAAHFRPLLQDAGFDVCSVSNADRKDYLETLVVDRSGRPRAAQRVCDHFQSTYGVGRIVLQTRASSPEGDVLVILGADLGAIIDPGQR